MNFNLIYFPEDKSFYFYFNAHSIFEDKYITIPINTKFNDYQTTRNFANTLCNMLNEY